MMKARVFDLGGALVDSDPDWVGSQGTLGGSRGGGWGSLSSKPPPRARSSPAASRFGLRDPPRRTLQRHRARVLKW